MLCDYPSLPHEGIRTIAPYIPGKSVETLAKEKGLTNIIKLASNENPLGCSPMVLEVLANLSPTKIANYAISAQHPLRGKIAQKFGITEEMVALSNGSDMLFPLLMQCFALHTGKHILIQDYAFIVYSIFAKGLGIPVVSTPLRDDWTVNVEALIAACNEKTALIFMANPNNPTGSRLPQTEIARILANIPESCLLVLDEAYYEFSTQESPTSFELLAKHRNLVITRTFSKAYGLAGLRIGYAIADEQIIATLHRVLASFTVNQAALTAASAALDDTQFLKDSLANNRYGLKQYQLAMDEIGCKYLPLNGNFITVNCQQDGGPVYQALLDKGIIVRPLHPYGLANYLRVSVGLPEQNARFIKQFTTIVAELKIS